MEAVIVADDFAPLTDVDEDIETRYIASLYYIASLMTKFQKQKI